ncbi:hypothetical protein MASR1M32_32150 [Rhodobacter sp.]
MRLGSEKVWLPVLNLQAQVSYRLHPVMTPVQRMLEAAVARFAGRDNALARAPIPQLFRELFGLSGADMILPEIVEDLIHRGRIHRLAEDGRPSAQLSIADLAPGRSARSVTGRQPTSDADSKAAQERRLSCFYDPILKEVVSGEGLHASPGAADRLIVPEQPFRDLAPDDWVAAELREQVQDDVTLYHAKVTQDAPSWRRCPVEIDLREGELRVEAADPRVTDYLKGLLPSLRRSWFLLADSQDAAAGLAPGSAELSLHCRLPEGPTGLALTCGLSSALIAELDLPASLVVFELFLATELVAPEFRPSTGGARHLSYSRKTLPVAAGFFLADEGRARLTLPMKWGDVPGRIEVFQTVPGFAAEASAWAGTVTAIEEECFSALSAEIFALQGYWMEPGRFWQKVQKRSEEETDSALWLATLAEALRALPPGVLDRLQGESAEGPALRDLRRSTPLIAEMFPEPHRDWTGLHAPEARAMAVPQDCRRVIAFDTSSLLSYGNLASALSPTDFLVMPQVIGQEVERRKTDSDAFRIASRANLRAIGRLPLARWATCSHDFDLLEPGDRRNNDGALIAALIPYCGRDQEVVIVSEDHDFLLRCRLYGIRWMRAAEFLDGSRNRIERRPE